MIKICFVTTVYGTYRAFLSKFALYLYESGNFDISLICNDDERIEKELPDYVHFYPVSMKRGVNFSVLKSIILINRIMKNNSFDIVQYSTPNAAFYTSIVARASKVPVRLYCQWGIRYMGFKGLRKNFFKLLEKIICYCSSFIEAESFSIHEFSLKEKLYNKYKSSVIWNGSASGVDLHKFDVSKRDKWRLELRKKYKFIKENVVYCFAGRLTADKGINELLEAFFNISAKEPNAKLIILGAMDNQLSLRTELWERAKNHQDIIFTGRVDDVEKYYACADVFVAPSYREGFGLVVVEAEAMRLPAIVSDVPGQIDAILPGITGLTCTVKSAISLQKVMEKMFEDRELRDVMGKNAVKYVVENYEQNELFEYLKESRIRLVEKTEVKKEAK